MVIPIHWSGKPSMTRLYRLYYFQSGRRYLRRAKKRWSAIPITNFHQLVRPTNKTRVRILLSSDRRITTIMTNNPIMGKVYHKLISKMWTNEKNANRVTTATQILVRVQIGLIFQTMLLLEAHFEVVIQKDVIHKEFVNLGETVRNIELVLSKVCEKGSVEYDNTSLLAGCSIMILFLASPLHEFESPWWAELPPTSTIPVFFWKFFWSTTLSKVTVGWHWVDRNCRDVNRISFEVFQNRQNKWVEILLRFLRICTCIFNTILNEHTLYLCFT